MNQTINEMLAGTGTLSETDIDHIYETYISPNRFTDRIEDEPERTAILDEVERQSGAVQWLRRRTDIDVIRHQGNAVQALVC